MPEGKSFAGGVHLSDPSPSDIDPGGEHHALRLPGPAFGLAKRGFDVLVAVAAMPAVGLAAVVLLLFNPVWNRGPLFYRQQRMGRGGRAFSMLKFRSMVPAGEIERGPDDPLETSRITPLGQFIRRTRIDELPQFVNVLRGDMSLVGPRPDFWDHALHYADTIPGYSSRYRLRPGITGLAQVDAGYAEGIEATLEKTRHDLAYIRGAGLAMEVYILRRTVEVVFTGFGAR